MADRPKVLIGIPVNLPAWGGGGGGGRYYESTAITPQCIHCGWHIHGPHHYYGDVGPFCAACAAEYAAGAGGGNAGGYRIQYVGMAGGGHSSVGHPDLVAGGDGGTSTLSVLTDAQTLRACAERDTRDAFLRHVLVGAADRIEALEARVAELGGALQAMFDEYEGVYDMAVPTRHQSAGAKRAESLARAALATEGKGDNHE